MSARLRRVLRRSTVAVVAAGALLAVSAPASAYPTPAGAGSGSCDASSQTVYLGKTADAVTCTYTFVDYAGNTEPGTFPASVYKSGYETSSTTPNMVNGSVAVTAQAPKCTDVGTLTETVTTSINTPRANTSAQAFSTVTCVKKPATIKNTGCTNSTNSTIGGYKKTTCSWTTNAPDGTPVSFNVSDPSSWAYAGSSNVSGGGFYTVVTYPFGATVGSVRVTGFVSESNRLLGNSREQTAH